MISSEKDRKQLGRVLQMRDEKVNQLQRQVESLKSKLIEVDAKAECAEKRVHKLTSQYRNAKDEQVNCNISKMWAQQKDTS